MTIDSDPFEKLDRLLAQFPPVRQPDSLYMTDTMRERIIRAADAAGVLVAKARTPVSRYAGLDIFCYPAGTVVINTKTGERSTIDENTVLSVIRSECRVIEPPSALLSAGGEG